jgi:hypothetical protein
MSFDKPSGIDVPPQAEKTEEQIEQLRKKYLEAMAAGMGANPLTSQLSSEALLRGMKELAGIDYSQNRHELDPETVEKIEAIGKWYLSGSSQADQFKFAVGARVLSLLQESPDSGYFTNLRDHVDYFTDGNGGEKFDAVIAGETPE